jgi:hypothetical protein
VDPDTNIVFAGENGLKVLANSRYAVVDGTFDLVKEHLILTTVMGYHDEIAVPCAYYLMSKKDHESYLIYFKVH